ncbi:glycosyltransferase [Gottfriedia sp. NPDC058432]|uniref:glycosyltransferase n=1 Tax=unclassified Gottfriedia TaxID=2837516 RepID=UPI0036541CD2
MKKVLFLVSDMESGGFQKSLVTLLQCFDYSKYKIDIAVFSPTGIFLNQIPKEVNLINLGFPPSFFKKFPGCILDLIKEKKIKFALKRTFHFLLSRLNKGYAAMYMSSNFPIIDEHYDVAIDYNGQQILYYLVDKIKANKKITYFHNDYEKWSYYYSADKLYYPKVDYIVTVSEICKQSLDKFFPECSHKTRVIENISSPTLINNMACSNLDLFDGFEGTKIVTVGRPLMSKGYDIAIKASAKLKANGYNFRWYSIGTSNEESKFKKMVTDLNLNNDFIFLGEKENPYPYIKQADLYAQPSRYEGKSVAIDEAKILNKPIIVTNFSTVLDQIENKVNGIITNMDEESVFKAIKEAIDYKEKLTLLTANLKNEKLGNEHEINKLYRLIENNQEKISNEEKIAVLN